MALDNTLSDALPNGYRSNGVINFCQNTKPTALAVGDRWYKISDGSEWYWNGSLWLSKETLVLGSDYKGVSISTSGDVWGTALTGRALATGKSGIFFINAANTLYSGSLNDFSNYWQFDFRVYYSDQTSDILATHTNMNFGGGSWAELRNNIQSAKSTLSKSAIFVYASATKVGNPSAVFVITGLEFKWVHP